MAVWRGLDAQIVRDAFAKTLDRWVSRIGTAAAGLGEMMVVEEVGIFLRAKIGKVSIN